MKRTIKIRANDDSSKVELTLRFEADGLFASKTHLRAFDSVVDEVYAALLKKFHASHIKLVK